MGRLGMGRKDDQASLSVLLIWERRTELGKGVASGIQARFGAGRNA